MRTQSRIRHDCSYAAASVLREILGPHVTGLGEKELFGKVYTAVVSAIEKYDELKADERRRLRPFNN